MAIDTVWTDPSTAGTIDLNTGGILTETIYDKILSNLKRLGGTAGLVQLTDAGLLLINETANANMTIGLTINQGANDNEILALKSSDVAHALTNVAEADTYGNFAKSAAATGGLWIRGFQATGLAQGAILLHGYLTDAAATAKTTGGYGVVRLRAAINSAGSEGAVGADGNLVTIDNAGTTRFIFDAEGTLHSIGAAQTERFGNGETLLVSPVINTPSASGHVYSGTYTPTLTGVTNIDATTARICQYMRVGNIVTVSGGFSIDCTTGSVASEIGISLPVASNFANEWECGGHGGLVTPSGTQYAGGQISADAVNDRAKFKWTSSLDTNLGYVFSFTYQVI